MRNTQATLVLRFAVGCLTAALAGCGGGSASGNSGGAAGQLVSTPRDLNRFWQALFDGELLAAEWLDEMKTTVSLPERFGAGAGYGLGMYRLPLSCGGFYWGHSGDHLGVQTLSGRAESGRRATVYITRRQGE
jgi:D-alanyl-D-alanine carboxypeptidase